MFRHRGLSILALLMLTIKNVFLHTTRTVLVFQVYKFLCLKKVSSIKSFLPYYIKLTYFFMFKFNLQVQGFPAQETPKEVIHPLMKTRIEQEKRWYIYN